MGKRKVEVDDTPADTSALEGSVAHRRGSGETGLANLGNTCFMNSILQCLSNCGPLRDAFLEAEAGEEVNTGAHKTRGRLAVAFGALLREMWAAHASVVAPRAFKRQVGIFAPRFMGFAQQDSQEFLRFLLDGVHEDLNRVKGTKPYMEIEDDPDASITDQANILWDYHVSRDDSLVMDLFRGQLMSTVTCSRCGKVSHAFDPFLDISLPIPTSSSSSTSTSTSPSSSSYSTSSRLYGASSYSRYSRGIGGGGGRGGYGRSAPTVSLDACLNKYTEPETLSGDEKVYCSSCKKHRTSTKQLALFRLPRVLVLHLKRFSSSSYSTSKLSNNVTFPLSSLDLSPFVSPDAPSSTSSATYSLFAVSNHSGGLGGGHYTAYAKSPDTDTWLSFNDATVSVVSEESVGGPAAYVLFYRRER